MVRPSLYVYAVLGVLLMVLGPWSARARTTGGGESAEVPPPTGSGDDTRPIVGPRAAETQARADAIEALVDRSLDPTVDARALFVFDLPDVSEDFFRALEPSEPDGGAPPPEPAPSPLAEARQALREALERFMALPPTEREARLEAHEARADVELADQRRRERLTTAAEALSTQAAGLEALVAGTLGPGADVEALLRVDGLEVLALGAVPANQESIAAFERKQASAKRLRNAYKAWLEMPVQDRSERRARAEAAPVPESSDEAPPIPEAFVDEDEVQEREDISDKEQEAADAAREKEEALDVARRTRSEALRVVAEQRALLLGVKESQALFAADLPRWKQETRVRHDSTLELSRRVEALIDGDTAGAAEIDTLLQAALDEAHAEFARALDRVVVPGQSVPRPPERLAEERLSADADWAGLIELQARLDAEAEQLIEMERSVAWDVASLLRDDVTMLSSDREQLLAAMSASRRSAWVGFGRIGRAQARREATQIGLEVRYHLMSLPRDVASLSDWVRDADPMEPVIVALKLIGLLALFRWWRINADRLLRNWRGSTWHFGQSTTERMRSSALWYAAKIRHPIEWLLLLAILPWVADGAVRSPELRLVWWIALWVQGARAVVVTVDAVAERQSVFGHGGPQSNAKLRYRSLRLVGLSVTVGGLVLTLSSEIVGKGTIYHWVLRLCWLAVVPIGIWLVSRWRTAIIRQLEAKSGRFSAWVVQQSGFVGFVAAAVGGVWLLSLGVGGWFIAQLSELDATRRVLAYFFRREVAKQAQTMTNGARGRPLSGVPYDRLGPESRSTQLSPLETVARDLLDSARARTASTECTLSVVVGERGLGKTTFLNRLISATEGTTCVVGCPPAGFEALLEVLAVQYDAPDYAEDSVIKAIRSAGASLICIDDAHRMIAPTVGGLDQLDQFTRFALRVGGRTSWVVSIQEATWHFVKRARGERVFFDQVLVLRRWTEEQIAMLIQRRTHEAELAPSFDALVVDGEAGSEKGARRTELGYYRILWDHSGGNPAVALQAWRESLFVADDERAPLVRLFQEPSATELDQLPGPLLFVLRALVQLELGTPEEVAECTQLPVSDVADALRFSVASGYVERTAGRYRLSWPWYRVVTRVLVRQHLLVG